MEEKELLFLGSGRAVVTSRGKQGLWNPEEIREGALSLLHSESAPNVTITFLPLVPALPISPRPNLGTFPMRRWSRNSASFLHSSQALSSSAVGKETPDTLCSVSGAPEAFHKDEEFCGGHGESMGRQEAEATQLLLQTSKDSLCGLHSSALLPPPPPRRGLHTLVMLLASKVPGS